MDLIRRQGNTAVHRPGPVKPQDSVRMAIELFHVLYWLARNYTRAARNTPVSGLSFDRKLIPTPVPAEVRKKKQAEIRKMAEDLALQQDELVQAQRRNKDLDAEILRLREEIKEAKATTPTLPTSTTTTKPPRAPTSSTSSSAKPGGTSPTPRTANTPSPGYPPSRARDEPT